MSLQVEMLEKGMAKLTIEVSADEFDKAVDKVYLKNRNKIEKVKFESKNTKNYFVYKRI